MLFRVSLLALFSACLCAVSVQAGTPRVFTAYPSGGQRGTELTVTFNGPNLSDARDVLFDDPGFQVTKVKSDNGHFETKVKIAPEAVLGEHLYRVVTDSGISDLRLFYVSPFPLVEMPKKQANSGEPLEVPMNTTVYGRTPAEAVDRYALTVKKGERLTAVVIGARLQTQNIYDPLVRIAKEDGTVLTEVDDTTFSRQDPVASIIAPEDGKYIVSIKDSTNSGLGECHYLMHLGNFLQPLGVYPPGGPAGQEISVTLLGAAGDPVVTKVKLPNTPNAEFSFFANEGAPAPMPNVMRVEAMPNVNGGEPDHDKAFATTNNAAAVPAAFNGIIKQKGDTDYFRFTAKKGQAYDVNVYGRDLRSPLDSVLAIYNAKGSRLALNDDEGSVDSHLRWTAPEDADFYLSVTDQLGRGGPLYYYRTEIKPVESRVAVYLPDMVINSSQERRAVPVPQGNRYATLVRIKRYDTSGGLELTPADLPAGVQVQAGPLDKAVDTIPMVFEAAPDAPTAQKLFTLAAKSNDPAAQSPTVPSAVEHLVEIIENGNQKAYYGRTEDRLPIAVTNAIPVKLTLIEPKAPALKNGSIELKVKVERSGDFKGPVTLSLLYPPPGIGSAGTTEVKEGQTEGKVTLSCSDKAIAQKWKVCVVGTANFGTGPVWMSTQLADLEVAPPYVTGKIQRTYVDQGDTSTITVKLDQNTPFEGKAKVTLQGLPAGVTAEPKEITKDDTEVKFDIKATPIATAGQHRALFCQFKLEHEGDEMTGNFAQGGVLRVDKATVAKNEEKK